MRERKVSPTAALEIDGDMMGCLLFAIADLVSTFRGFQALYFRVSRQRKKKGLDG